MKKLFIALFILSCVVRDVSAQGINYSWEIAPSSLTLPIVYCGATSYPSFSLFDGIGQTQTARMIAYNYYGQNSATAPNPGIIWTLLPAPGGSQGTTTASFPGNASTFTNTANQTPTTPDLVLANFYGGEVDYTLNATLCYDITNPSYANSLSLATTNIGFLCQPPVGVGQGSNAPSNYCSFQLAPISYPDPSIYGGNIYSGNPLEFTYGSPADAYDCGMSTGYNAYPYYIAPGPEASSFSYMITSGWSYAYVSTVSAPPNTINVIAPDPTQGVHAAYSSTGTLVATGSGSGSTTGSGSSTNCITSYAALPLQVDYPADSVFHHYIDTTVTPIFTHPTLVNAYVPDSIYDLGVNKDIQLVSNLQTDQPNYVSIDWYEIDTDGVYKLLTRGKSSIDVKVEGDYIAMANLAQGATIDAKTGAPENYTGNTYYIAQSNVVEIYNSNKNNPNVDSLVVYPNPSCKKISVNYALSGKVKTATLMLTSVSTGQVVMTEDLHVEQEVKDMDISKLTDGTYLVTILLNGSLTYDNNYTIVKTCN